MRKFKNLLIVMAVFIPAIVMGQTNKTATTPPSPSAYEVRLDSLLSRIDSLVMINNQWLEQMELDLSLKNRYKLYQTENIYNLLRLDTKTGKIEQVQWSLDSDEEMTVTINNVDLSVTISSPGAFELYPTKNMYQFILMDKTDGRMWHVQWGLKKGERWIRRMY